jgi:dTDP-4-amino-4,6-dideoxygalactose transaminase
MGKLALTGGTPVRQRPFTAWPVLDESDVEAVAAVVRSGRWGRIGSMGGSRVREFETAFAAYQGARYGLAVHSGTGALEVALKAVGIGPGDEVIVPPYTFMGSATSVLLVGAVPVFVDIDPQTYNIDPALIEAAITSRTRAIMPVHFGGLPCDMDRILEIARRHNLAVIEDAAHGHGGRWRDRGLGTIGTLGCFSLQASKNLNAGEGGCILTDDEELWRLCVRYHDPWRGRVQLDPEEDENIGWRVRFPVISWNYKMTEFQGALLLSQLARLEEQAQRRNQNGRYLDAQLRQIEGMTTLRIDPYVTRHAYHIYIVRYTGEGFGGLPREQLITALQAEGIPLSAGYLRPLYAHPAFAEAPASMVKGFPVAGSGVDYRATHCPQTERLCREETLWFSQSLLLGERADMDDIAAAILKVKENAAELVGAAV